MADFKKGQLVTLSYEGRNFDVIVIDPNGLGENQPSVGLGFRMADRHAGIPQPTLSGWVIGSGDSKALKPPSGKEFRVIDITGVDGNQNSVTVTFSTAKTDAVYNILLTPRIISGTPSASERTFAITNQLADSFTIGIDDGLEAGEEIDFYWQTIE